MAVGHCTSAQSDLAGASQEQNLGQSVLNAVPFGSGSRSSTLQGLLMVHQGSPLAHGERVEPRAEGLPVAYAPVLQQAQDEVQGKTSW